MNPDRVHALVARCLTEPTFLSAALASCNELSCGEIRDEPKTDATVAAQLLGKVELEKLRLFSGFITKIKHNPLRTIVPLTLRLLPQIGEEAAFFASYSAGYLEARARGPLPLDRQLVLFDRHLRIFLKGCSDRIRAIVGDLMTHETAIRHMLSQRSAHMGADVSAIRWRGCFETRHYETDVLAVCDALQGRTFDPEADPRVEAYILAYWRPEGSDRVSFFEIDEATGVILSLVDGRRGIADIAAALAANRINDIGVAELDEFFAEASARGLVIVSELGAQR